MESHTEVDTRIFKECKGLTDSYRMKRFDEVVNEKRLNLLCFTLVWSTCLFLDHVLYTVRQYVPKPLQCKNCWKLAHSLCMSRSEFATCGGCQESDCERDHERDPKQSIFVKGIMQK